jgi:hypothetical protein
MGKRCGRRPTERTRARRSDDECDHYDAGPMPDASPSPSANRVRDRAHVEREYGTEKWPTVARSIARHADREPAGASTLARVHRGVVRDYAYRDAPMAELDVFIAGRRQPMLSSLAWGAQSRLISDAVVDACTEATDLVIELGCGWGWHIIGSWLAGGPREALYVGAEYTAAGRGATQNLADLDPELRFRALAFDYNDPFAALGSVGTFRDAVVFSVHSIEQIPHLSADVPRAIAGLAERVRCLHFEPVGWQVSQDSGGSSQAYAEHHDYNRDLLSVLRAEQAAGALSIDEIALDLVGLNPSNSSTLVRWSAGA